MFTTTTITRNALLLAVCCALWLSGCGQFRVPAIDPTGRRIFAPAGTYTSLDPGLASLGRGFQPAFTPAPPVPPCPDLPPSIPPGYSIGQPCCPDPCNPCGPSIIVGPPVAPPPQFTVAPPTAPPPVAIAAGPQAVLELTPGRLIAPVGSEVVLRAGVRGGRGNLRPDEPIEWVLSQESVGHLVDVGARVEPTVVERLLHTPPENRRTGSYAVGRTYNENALLHRGTPDRADDVQIERGQGWVSVTSAAEGVSRVSAVALGNPNWQGRLQTAVVQWIDAQWSTPAPSIVRSGQPHTLTTVMTRSTDGTPLVGWVVRYEVVDGPPAEFVAPDGYARGPVADATTDSNGQASVNISPTTGQAGTTRVRIQMFRPASADGSLGAVAVGEAFTSVTWSAPGLSVNLAGPQQVTAGQPATYHIEVANPGDMPVTNVVVVQTLPPEMTFRGSEPAGAVFGNRVQWSLPQIEPGMVAAIDLSVRADGGGDVQNVVTVTCDEGLTAEASAVTRIFENGLSIRASGPVSAQVGQAVTFEITVTNLTNQSLSNIIVTDELGPGYVHETGVQRIERPVGDLGPRESLEFAVTLTVMQPGELCHNLTARADGGHYSATRPCISVTPPPPVAPPAPPMPEPQAAPEPALTLRLAGPEGAQVGRIAQFQATVINSGTANLTNVKIASGLDAGMVATLATPGFFQEPTGIYWNVKELPAGTEVKVYVHARCDRVNPQACHRITVTCDQLEPNVQQSCVAVRAEGAALPARSVVVGNSVGRTVGGDSVGDRPSSLELSPARSRTSNDVDIEDIDSRRQSRLPQDADDDGSLDIRITASDRMVVVGGQTKFHILVQNRRSAADYDVAITLDLPESLRFDHLADGPIAGRVASEDGRQIALAPIREMRPGETIALTVILRTQRSGRAAVTATATSRRQLNPSQGQATMIVQ